MRTVVATSVAMAAACAPMRDVAPSREPLSYVSAPTPEDPLAPRPAPVPPVVTEKLPPPPGAQARPPAPPEPFRSNGGAWPPPPFQPLPPTLEGVLMSAPLVNEPAP